MWGQRQYPGERLDQRVDRVLEWERQASDQEKQDLRKLRQGQLKYIRFIFWQKLTNCVDKSLPDLRASALLETKFCLAELLGQAPLLPLILKSGDEAGCYVDMQDEEAIEAAVRPIQNDKKRGLANYDQPLGGAGAECL